MSLTEFDLEDSIRTWRNDGIAEGIEIGRMEGEQREAVETAQRMLKNGKLSNKEIADISGLTLCEVQSLC